MKDFALDLNGCSKEDRKRVEEILSSIGLVLDSELPFKGEKSKCLSFDEATYYYLSNSSFVDDSKPIYQMPSDWSKIQEALGVSVEPMLMRDFEDGKMYTYFVDKYENKVMLRSSDYKRYHSLKGASEGFNALIINGSIGFKDSELSSVRELTDDEKSEHIANEHQSGYHWDGESLVKIPEYVYDYWGKTSKIIDISQWGIKYDGGGSSWESIRPSTREAYEAQEVEKKRPLKITLKIGRSGFGESPIKQIFESPYEFSKQYSQNPFHYDVIGLHAENEGLYVKIKDLEISNNELNVEIETKDKRIAELEGNLIIMCELGNKVLS